MKPQDNVSAATSRRSFLKAGAVAVGAGAATATHQLEHDAMYAALRAGETINNGTYMAKSTMMAIMGRM